MTNNSQKFLEIALTRRVVVAAIKVTIVVGSALALINHGSDIMRMNVTLGQACQIMLTYLVPYCVATYSSVKAIQNQVKLDK